MPRPMPEVAPMMRMHLYGKDMFSFFLFWFLMMGFLLWISDEGGVGLLRDGRCRTKA